MSAEKLFFDIVGVSRGVENPLLPLILALHPRRRALGIDCRQSVVTPFNKPD